ncbi:hypothetical protein SAMN06264855_1722 [Halorubrum vacuolatum]|uniref:Uncharacterized protein n=1 Tax=Halorubrum vacuolatum TaxID=63740 RepID=A0A238YPQ8_HALVU|nr:hypothetical protein SAMN06264855_1722 [Halorubrum vacuolatum]
MGVLTVWNIEPVRRLCNEWQFGHLVFEDLSQLIMTFRSRNETNKLPSRNGRSTSDGEPTSRRTSP